MDFCLALSTTYNAREGRAEYSCGFSAKVSFMLIKQGNLYRMEVDVKKRKRKDQSKPAASKPDGLECSNRSQMIALYL